MIPATLKSSILVLIVTSSVLLFHTANANIWNGHFKLASKLNKLEKHINFKPELQSVVRHMVIKQDLPPFLRQGLNEIGGGGLVNKPYKERAQKASNVADPFTWKSCGPPNQLVDIHNLTIKPSPLYFPGQLSFGFDIVFHDTITTTDQVSASLKLEFSKGGGSWIPIPCIGQIGSCDYPDLCTLTQGIQCPEDLKQKGIPCTCPFKKGEYKLPNYNVEVDASVFLSGNYRAQAVLKDSVKGQIACYQVNFSVA